MHRPRQLRKYAQLTRDGTIQRQSCHQGASDVQSIRTSQTADSRAKQTRCSSPARRSARVNSRSGDGDSPGSAFSFEGSGGEFSEPAPFSWPSSARVAAQNLARQWIGVNISPKAVELVNMRLQQFMGNLFRNRLVTARTEIPSRTDIDVPVPYRQTMHVRFGQQEGRCKRVSQRVPVPRPRSGPHHPPWGWWPGQHRQPATTANSLQPGQTRLASGVPKPIPRWDVHFEGLEDYRKDPNTTAAGQ